ncbi:hypothetical protein HK103_005284 [Boothiomyces macroporosus]|uniref:Cyclic nucleotide-binding domain-containing protein n=1 Tax=Boothiomyces macroporosus TaxID=261099 RepID=A0AAD5UFD6_9FUNG|nr:hypothetical protein HK103_000321 [Boothiomyces macroporosus]KAJ3256541.1 hypothetical protein HK103_005284 [Boothiomyces macroporosus]
MKAYIPGTTAESSPPRNTKPARKLVDIANIKITTNTEFGSQDTVYCETPIKCNVGGAKGSASSIGPTRRSPTNIETQLEQLDQFATQYRSLNAKKAKMIKKSKHLSIDVIDRCKQKVKPEHHTISESKLNLPCIKRDRGINTKASGTMENVDKTVRNLAAVSTVKLSCIPCKSIQKLPNIKFPKIGDDFSGPVKRAQYLCRISEDQLLSNISKRKWMQIFLFYQLLRKAVKTCKIIAKQSSERVFALPHKDSELVTVPSIVELISNNQLASRVKHLLIEPQYKRSHEYLEELQKLLYSQVTGFSKYPKHQRLYFCNVMALETYAKLYLLNSGEIFGGECLLSETCKRLYTAATTEKTVLLKIDKDDYTKVSFSNKYLPSLECQQERDLLYKTLSETTFAGYEPILQLLINSNSFQLHLYSNQEQVVHENSEITEMQFIISGRCKITRNLPFLRNDHSKVLEPCDYDSSTNPNFVTISVEIGILQPGDYFPLIPRAIEHFTQSSFTKKTYYQLFNCNDSKKPCGSHQLGMTAIERVAIGSICFKDFIHMVPEQLLYKMIVNSNEFQLDLKYLQEKYLNKIIKI